MSKKDFELIAETIRKHVTQTKELYADSNSGDVEREQAKHEYEALSRVAISLASELRDTHPAFKFTLFVSACGCGNGIES